MKIVSLLGIDSGVWKHPWKVSVHWDEEKKLWMAAIRPGLINAQEAVMELPAKEAPWQTRDRFKRQKKKLEGSVECWLSERPRMAISSWRMLGMDAALTGSASSASGQTTLNYEQVPDYFLVRGVGKAPKQVFNLDAFKTEISGSVEAEDSKRLLRACELILVIDKPATRAVWSTGNGIDGMFAQFDLVEYFAPGGRKRPRVVQRPKWQNVAQLEMFDYLSGGAEELPYDELHIATIWMMSSPHAAFGSDPDGSWVPVVQQRLFWPEHHCVQRLDEAAAPLKLSLQTGLAGGVGDALNSLILSQVNDENSLASQLVARKKTRSHHWSV